ncbi:hypothetical protein NDR87_09825 [Nocardia sp. CDC159]|uniref:Uncharacterized protein n=1 Tax=Nocardia pulmonis TaxID=2951408 RepID=A0A9X2IVD2_9NOCA|nr:MULTISPECIES: hypothetical protein [Nocardia]MCM6773767.1 hypothetical protein [Nocardia pulmonis]MCM6786654.1 hypothetical protein [Nocardia sp. CDC159]
MWLLKGLMFALLGALVLSISATIVFAMNDHPECVAIPGDVGPCGFWPQVGYIGPFVILWGTFLGTGIAAAFLLVAAAIRGLILALSRRQPASSRG